MSSTREGPAANVLDYLAAGIQPDRARLIAAALALDTLIKTTTPSRDLLDAAAGLQILATGGTLDLDETGRNRARKFAFVPFRQRKKASPTLAPVFPRPIRELELPIEMAARAWAEVRSLVRRSIPNG